VKAASRRLSSGPTRNASTVRSPARLPVLRTITLDPLRESLARSAIAATREVPVLAGVLGDRAEVLGAVALVLRESQRFVAEPAAAG
jgi:hypothetical protein